MLNVEKNFCSSFFSTLDGKDSFYSPLPRKVHLNELALAGANSQHAKVPSKSNLSSLPHCHQRGYRPVPALHGDTVVVAPTDSM